MDPFNFSQRVQPVYDVSQFLVLESGCVHDGFEIDAFGITGNDFQNNRGCTFFPDRLFPGLATGSGRFLLNELLQGVEPGMKMVDILFGGHIQALQQGFNQPFPVGPRIHVM